MQDLQTQIIKRKRKTMTLSEQFQNLTDKP
jgi:hypothetical protein